MQLSAKYANRGDLSTFLKWKFHIEDRIQANPRVRALYRRYFLLPKWAHDALLFVWLLMSMLPLMLGGLCDEAVQWVVGPDEDGARRGDGIGLTLFVLALLTIVHFVPFGWIFALMTAQLIIVFWLLMVMDDYDQELRREFRDQI